MKNIFRLIYNNIKSIFSIKVIFILSLIFGFIFLYKKDNLITCVYLEDYIKYIFYGHKKLLDNIPELFVWSLYQFSFIGIMAKYLNKEFKVRNIYSISRLGTKFNWYCTVQLTILFSSLVYYFIAFVEISIFSFFNNISISILSFNRLVLMIVLVTLTSYFYINIYMNFMFLSGHSTSALLYIILLIYLAIYFGGTFNINSYNPFTQAFFSNINKKGFLIIPNIYLILLNTFEFVVTYRKILFYDITTIVD